MASIKDAVYNHSPVWLQNLLVSTYGYHLYRKRYTGIYQEIRELVRESREWTPAQVESYQSEKLHRMVRHCRNSVPYYQKLLAEYGLHENDFTHPSHISKLPVLTKSTLRENMEDFRARGSKPYVVQHTSGSTGTPLALDVDEYTYKLAMALLVDHEEFHGVPFGARRATFAGRMIQPSTNMRPPFARMNHAENQKLFSSYHLNSKTFSWYDAALRKFRPVELIGYPSAISDLATHYLSKNLKPGFVPKAIITNSETLLDWQRDKIECVFECQVFDYYGTAEYVLFAGQENERYRLSPVIGVAELVSQDGYPGTEGRLVATSLTNRVMPLLRYEIGDTASSDYATTSGTVEHLIKVNGRADDYIDVPDGRRVGRLDHIFKGVSGIAEAQIVQVSPTECLINVVEQPGATQVDHSLLKANFQSRTSKLMDVKVNIVQEIPRGKNGKFKSVIKNTN